MSQRDLDDWGLPRAAPPPDLAQQVARLRYRRSQLHAIGDPVKRRLEELAIDGDEDVLFAEHGGRLAVEKQLTQAERRRDR